jgi:diguanylate cyclase (GGDEF)-like protein
MNSETPPGVVVLAELGRGAHTVVQRIRRDGREWAMKVFPDLRTGDGSALVALRREAALLAWINHPGLPQVHEVGVAGRRPYLIMDLIEGRSLAEVLRLRPLPVDRTIRLAIQVAGALGALHRAGLVHRDVKPHNIMIETDGTARLIDVGMAGRATSGPASAPGDDPDGRAQVVGTLLYSAPEQAGTLNRPVDARTDLYALGVALHECLAGAPPFDSTDAGELLRMHATAPPPDLGRTRPEVPATLAAIVARLLAKDPDDRYQTAAGLRADLQRLADDPATAFAPGRDDIAGQVAEPAPLTGRERELAELVERWRQARAGRGGYALIRGGRGAGKSRLARELAARAREDGVAVLLGACPEDPAPLAPLRAALGGRLDRVRAEDPEAHTRAVAGVLVELARTGGGALLCLDDAHRADEATLAVLRLLAVGFAEPGETAGADLPLLVLLTVDEAADPLPPVVAGRVHPAVTLGPLGADAATALVAALAHGRNLDGDLLGRLAARAGTTPFEIQEYVAAVVDGGALEPYWGRWRLDAAGLDRIALPSDLRALVLRRLDGLSEPCRALLTAAAVIGTRFPAALAVAASGAVPGAGPGADPRDPGLGRRLLAEAAARGAVRPQDGGYAFAHEQLRALLLDAADPALLRDVHQRLAELLDASGSTGPEHAYALARHCLHGHLDRDPAKVVAACLAAGALALADNAPAEAVALLEPAHRLAADRLPAAVASRTGEQLGTAYHLVGHLTQAIDTLHAALPAADGPVARARILLGIGRVHADLWNVDAGLETMHRGLAELGRRLPGNPLRLLASTLARFAAGLVVERTRIGFGTATGESADRLRLEAELYRAGGAVASLGLKPALAVAVLLRSLYPMTRLGASVDYVHVRTDVAAVLDIVSRNGLRGGYAQATRVAAELGDDRAVAYVAQTRRMVAHTAGRGLARDILADAADPRHDLGAGRFITMLGGALWLLLLAGYSRDANLLYLEGKARLAAADLPEHSLLVAGASVCAALGRVAEADAALRRVEGDLDVFANPSARVTLLLARAQVAVEQRDLGADFDRVADDLAALAIKPALLLVPLRSIYAYLAHGRLEQCRVATPARRAAALAAARQAVAVLRRAAGSDLLKAHARVAAARLHQLGGEPARALAALAAAEPLLRAVDAPLASFEAARLRAQALAALGHHAEAVVAAAGAGSLALRHEWPHRAQWIIDEFGDEALTGVAGMSRSVRPDETAAHAGGYRQRLDAVAALSLAASRIVDPGELVRVALDETIRLLSAERAYLFLTADGGEKLTPHLGRDAAGNDLTELVGYGSTLVERARHSREPLVVTGTDEGAALGSRSAVAHGLRSIMVAPMLHDDRLLGVLYLDSRIAKGMFTTADVGVLAAITTHVAAALETARAAQLTADVRSAEHERDMAQTLRTAMEHLSGTLDPADVLDRLRAIIVRAVHGDRAGLAVLDGDKVLLVDPDHRDDDEAVPAIVEPEPALAAILAGPAPVTGGEAARPPAFAHLAGAAWLAVPLHTRGAGGEDTTGLVFVVSDRPGAYGEPQRELAALLAGQGMIAYENARLFKEVERLAITDGLTGLLNRRQFFQLADRELAVARRRQSPLTAVMLDIDHFKQVNDRHGHPVGDQVIVAVARRLAAATRKTDLLGRYGGEEFAIFLPDTGREGAAILAERIRAGLAERPVDTDAGPLPITASIGLAEYDPGDTEPGTLLARADEALYRAKQAGRNRVVHHADAGA